MRERLQRKKYELKTGFTLIELMVVIVILGIIGGLVVPQFMDEPQKARVVKARLQIENISVAVRKFYFDHGYYLTTEQGLEGLVKKPALGRIPKTFPKDGYLAKVPKDPWGNAYIYISPGNHGPFDLISLGADGVEGGEDFNADINSWEIE